jgi:hypothetical protein
MSGVTTAVLVGGAIAAAGSVAGATISAHAAGSAAKTQAKGEQTAQNIQQQEWNQQQANEAPFLQAGQGALGELQKDVEDPNFSKYPGGTFQAPTLAQAEQMPGYKFQLEQGTNAIDQNAAANGSLLSGNTGKALTDYGQGLAQTGYGNLYNQALQQYMTNYGVWNNDTTNQVNRLQTLANTGANSAANLGSQGQAAATNLGNEAVGQATALASGTVGAANAITGGITNATNSISQIPLYQMLAQTQQNNSSYPGSQDPLGLNYSDLG